MHKIVLIILASLISAPANAQWTETMEKTYLYCMSKYSKTKGEVGCQCDVEQIARGKLPLETVEYCSKHYKQRP